MVYFFTTIEVILFEFPKIVSAAVYCYIATYTLLTQNQQYDHHCHVFLSESDHGIAQNYSRWLAPLTTLTHVVDVTLTTQVIPG